MHINFQCSVYPLPTDFGFGPVTYFDLWHGNGCDMTEDLMYMCGVTGPLAPLLFPKGKACPRLLLFLPPKFWIEGPVEQTQAQPLEDLPLWSDPQVRRINFGGKPVKLGHLCYTFLEEHFNTSQT